MKLRAYEAKDFEAIIQLWWTSWHSSSGYVHHRPIADWKQRWHELETSHEIVVIENNETVLAFAALWHSKAIDKQNCVLSQIFVAPGWKKQGLGRQLMRWVSSRCAHGFSLKTAADNREAIAFYEKAGLQKIGYSTNDFNGKKEVEYRTARNVTAKNVTERNVS
ncbi:MAG: GNAT family N-acetyltransferase [Phormidesmis sp.]